MGTMPLTIGDCSQKVANYIKTNVGQTLKAIAEATGLSPSSVYRHRQAIARRNQYVETLSGGTAFEVEFSDREGRT